MELWNLQNGDLLDPKGGLFEPHPPPSLNPLTNTQFFAHFVTKSGPFGRFGGGASHPLATGLSSIINTFSIPHDINADVPQGSILGPILFLLFINDMPTILSQCSIEMYADDTLLYTYGKDVDKIKHALNNDLKQLEN